MPALGEAGYGDAPWQGSAVAPGPTASSEAAPAGPPACSRVAGVEPWPAWSLCLALLRQAWAIYSGVVDGSRQGLSTGRRVRHGGSKIRTPRGTRPDAQAPLRPRLPRGRRAQATPPTPAR